MTSSDRKQGHARAPLVPLRSFLGTRTLTAFHSTSSSTFLQSRHSSKSCSNPPSTASTTRTWNLFAFSTSLLPLLLLSRSKSFQCVPLSEISRDSQPSPKSFCCLNTQKRNLLLSDDIIDNKHDTVYGQNVRYWLEYQPASLNMQEINKTTPPLVQRH